MSRITRRLTCRAACYSLLTLAALFLTGCPKANQDFEAGRKAENINDYDTALVHYERALRSDPTNAEYKLRTIRMRSEDGNFHVEQGEADLQKGSLELALAEFQKAAAIDPGNSAAPQQAEKTMGLIEAKRAANEPKTINNPNPDSDEELLSQPPALKPLSREPITLKTNDCIPSFQAIAKMAGIGVIFDPDFEQQQQGRKMVVDLPNVTLEQALDAVSLQCKAFWKPLTSSVIFVATDNPDKRRSLEDQDVQTFYLSNTMGSSDKDATDIVSALRNTLGITKISQVAGQNAIVIRDTPAKLVLASKMIQDLDKAKPEILLHIQVLSVNRDRLRDLGILPGQTVAVSFNPPTSLQTTTSTTTPTNGTTPTTSLPQIALNNLERLGTSSWSATLPGATANAILTDSKTQVIQDPEIRMTEGEKTSLNIGEKIPYASGSFLGGGVGVSAAGVSSLVSTQFQQQDVGVIINVADSRVHPDGDVSMQLSIEVSAVAGEQTIGNLQEPIISQRKIDPVQFRLKDGESSVLGGLIERDVTTSVNGIPGVAQVPIFRYLFSDNNHQVTDQEVLIVVTPHVIRFPSITADDLRSLASGSETQVRVYRKDEEAQPAAPAAHPSSAPAQSPQPAAPAAAQLHFDPATVALKAGDTTTVGLAISNVKDLYSVPLLIHYNPAVIHVEEVRDGGFLTGGNQQISIVSRIDPERGEVVVSATRAPNTPGVDGSGTLLGLVVRAVAPGNAALQVLEVNARNSQHQAIPITSGEASIQVQ